jgi:F-type H+-transporting ATPase subunit a
MLIIGLYSIVNLYLFIGQGHLIPSPWQSVIEEFYTIVYGVMFTVLGNQHSQRFIALVFSMALLVLICNLVGMFPYSFAVTSHLSVTIFLATLVFVPITSLGLTLHKIKFFGFFLPAGCPILLVPLLVPIEMVVYFFRVISLAVRLFANIMAGHILLKVLAGFGWSMFQSDDSILFVLHILPILVVFALFGLELGVAFIQAYVWTMLTCIYLNDAIYLH